MTCNGGDDALADKLGGVEVDGGEADLRAGVASWLIFVGVVYGNGEVELQDCSPGHLGYQCLRHALFLHFHAQAPSDL